jgi:hypothetical protein
MKRYILLWLLVFGLVLCCNTVYAGNLLGKWYAGGGDADFTNPTENSANVYGAAATTTVDVNVQEDDLIVVHAACVHDFAITNIADSDTNSYTLRTELTETAHLRSAYCLSAKSDQTPLTVTVTYATGGSRRMLVVVHVYRPASGETVSFDCAATKDTNGSPEASPWETDSDSSTTGDDEVCSAAFMDNAGVQTYSNEEIPSTVAADETTFDGNGFITFHRILSATVSNIEAEVDITSSREYVAEMLCFKSVP